MRKLKISEIDFTHDLYPRSNLDTTHIGSIVRAMKMGVQFPPLVICKRTKRGVDGRHRWTGYQRLYGDDHKVDVVEKEYRNDKELFLDALRYNASHGKKFDSYDHAHCLNVSERLEIDDSFVAQALHVDPDYIGGLRVDRMAYSGSTGLHVPIKNTIRHMAGRKLTQRQEKAIESVGGMNQLYYVNQVILLIESRLLDTENEKLMGQLQHLGGLIEGLAVAS